MVVVFVCARAHEGKNQQEIIIHDSRGKYAIYKLEKHTTHSTVQRHQMLMRIIKCDTIEDINTLMSVISCHAESNGFFFTLVHSDKMVQRYFFYHGYQFSVLQLVVKYISGI